MVARLESTHRTDLACRLYLAVNGGDRTATGFLADPGGFDRLRAADQERWLLLADAATRYFSGRVIPAGSDLANFAG
jgi:hypothetical protein